jgi:signal transduction histidine kinase
MLADLAAQAAPALRAGRLASELADSRERLVAGRLDERARLRRALHDGMSPTLSGIAIAAAAAGSRAPDDQSVRRLLRRIEEEAGRGALTLRALLDDLRPPGLADLGLVGALEQRAGELAEATGLTYAVSADQPLPPLDAAVEQTAFLVAIEGMANVARHALASTCRVQLAGDGDWLRLRVDDDGAGMTPGVGEGIGLRSARERVAACGGQLELSVPSGGGASLCVSLPAWSPAS